MMWVYYLIGFGAGMIAGLWTAYVLNKYRKSKKDTDEKENEED